MVGAVVAVEGFPEWGRHEHLHVSFLPCVAPPEGIFPPDYDSDGLGAGPPGNRRCSGSIISLGSVEMVWPGQRAFPPGLSTRNPAHTLLRHLSSHSQCRRALPLLRPCFIAVVLRIQVRRSSESCSAAGCPARSWVRLSPCHQPVAKRVAKVVKTDPLAVLDLHTGLLCRRPQMIDDED
jgi:hypothetical protein